MLGLIYRRLVTVMPLHKDLYGIMPATAHNPLTHLPYAAHIKIEQWFPQGWGFYSKDPRDVTFQVVAIDTGKQVVDWPNNRLVNWFGLKRSGRSQGVEAGLLQETIRASDWQETEVNPLTKLKQMSPIKLTNKTPFPTISGDIGFIKQEALPWS